MARRHLRVRPEAESELSFAARWYETKRPGLGVEFMAAVDRAFDQIADAPEINPVWHDRRPFRKYVLQRFPYVVFFTLTPDTVHIVAVAHAKRRPGYWLKSEL